MGGVRVLAALGLLEVAALAAMGWLSGGRGTPFPAFLLWGVAWGALGLALWWSGAFGGRVAAPGGAVRGSGFPAGDDDPDRYRAVVWGVAVAGRVALFPLPPHFSDDIWRYLWDGRVAINGINPYSHPPDAAALETLRSSWHHLINHPSIPTIYPPGAQVVFVLLAVLGPGVLLYKAAWIGADLGVGRILERLESDGDGPGLASFLWLWSPLVLVEVAWSGHMDPVGILPMVAALLFLRPGGRPGPDPAPRGAAGSGDSGRRRDLIAGALLGLGAAVKFAPAAALPALWRRRGGRAALVGLLVPALLALPYLWAGAGLLDGLGEYTARWRFNAGLFLPLETLLGSSAARAAAVGAPGVAAAWAAWRRWPVDRALLWALGAGLLLAPTLHPWYLLWILPLAALRRSPAWILFTATVFLAYFGHDVYRATGDWPEPLLLRVLIHGPVLLALAWEALADRPAQAVRR